ncbi:MAG: hypothetical protein EBV64_14465 [Oxalobacteraceae bacterium]|nr:hypothetical protein [Oxalobacteraceae bacterium]
MVLLILQNLQQKHMQMEKRLMHKQQQHLHYLYTKQILQMYMVLLILQCLQLRHMLILQSKMQTIMLMMQ